MQTVSAGREFISATAYGYGHINDTYLVRQLSGGKKVKYILQRVNHHVFKKPEELMANISNVTAYMSDYLQRSEECNLYEVLELILTNDNESYLKDEWGNFWRIYVFIENASGYLYAESESMLYSMAKAFGNFQKMLSSYPAHKLYETIVNFHNTPE